MSISSSPVDPWTLIPREIANAAYAGESIDGALARLAPPGVDPWTLIPRELANQALPGQSIAQALARTPPLLSLPSPQGKPMSKLSSALAKIGIPKSVQKAAITTVVPGPIQTLASGLFGGSKTNAPQLPAPQGPGGKSTVFGGTITLPGGISVGGGFGTGYNTPQATGGSSCGCGTGACAPGYHVNKLPLHASQTNPSGAAPGTRCLRNRKMNVLNPRALSRANRRVVGFAGAAGPILKALGYSVSKHRTQPVKMGKKSGFGAKKAKR